MSDLFAAVDLGASSGRVMVGRVDSDGVRLREVLRFPNAPVRVGDRLYWDFLALYQGVLAGLRAAGRDGTVTAVGVDGWAVDYGLLDSDGRLLGNPVCYRDARTDPVMPAVHAELDPREIYAETGIQMQPFNTLYQLKAAVTEAAFPAAETLLLLPDLIGYFLTGSRVAEQTNASTTQLYAARTGTWSPTLTGYLGLPAGLLPPVVPPGTDLGGLLPHVARDVGLPATCHVLTVASHDTASAVAAVPATTGDVAYLSCGTWSLVGLELDRPILTEDARSANFTSEAGVDGTVRFLRNVMGLWLVQESLRTWRRQGSRVDLTRLLRAAAARPPYQTLIDPDHPAFLAPGDMPARIAAFCTRTGQRPPRGRAATVRCVLDSLALAYDAAIRCAERITGRRARVLHLVGGGANNELLCQLTADACGRPVHAGPVEAAALGNVLVQARARGHAPQDLAGLRALVAASTRVRTYPPRPDTAAVTGRARSRFAAVTTPPRTGAGDGDGAGDRF